MLASLVAACAAVAPPPPPAPPSPLPPPVVDGPVWTDVVVAVDAPVPDRFRAPVGSAVGGGAEPLPPATLAHRLCSGTVGAREELLRALAEGGFDEWWPVLSAVDCDDPGFCAFVTDALTGPTPGPSALWALAAECRDPRLDARLVAEAPPWFVLSVADQRALPWDPRLASLDAELGDDPGGVTRLGRLLAESAAPEAAVALRALRRRVPAAERTSIDRPSPLADLQGAFAADLDPASALARFPGHRSAVVDALETCVRDAASRDPVAQRRCGRALAIADRERAARVVAETEDAWGLLADVLVVPPAEARARLVALGLDDRDRGAAGPPGTWGELLEDMGHARVLGWIPRLGDAALAYAIADLAGAGDVEFEVVPPSPSAPVVDGRTPRAALFAWTGSPADGRRLRTLLDPGFDAVHTVGLVNAVLAELGRPERAAVDRSRTTVVVATPEALRALSDQGILRWAELEDFEEGQP